MFRDFHFYQKNLSEVYTKKILVIFRRICSIFGKFEKMLNFVADKKIPHSLNLMAFENSCNYAKEIFNPY